MISSARPTEEIYDITSYTDAELYNLLDLNNPTDRELEAKIHFLIHKYKNMQNADAYKIAKFFEDIYDHFFEGDEDDSVTEQEDQAQEQDNAPVEGYENIKTSYAKEVVEVEGNVRVVDARTGNATPSAPLPTYATTASTFNKQLDYVPDKLNPILKPTTTRILVIDSQYRDDKSTFSTDFTFNLSEPLHDVVLLKLSYVNIPYSWYTVSKSYGSNFFFLKGAVGGINNGDHDISFSVAPGNYSPLDLKLTLNESITTAGKIYPDISFGNTYINYNSFTGLSTITVDISNVYNENSFTMGFTQWKTPNPNLSNPIEVSNRQTSIPSYLGFINKQYSANSINSQFFANNVIIANNADKNYTITENNNAFRVIKYTPSFNGEILQEWADISNNPAVFDASFTVKLGLSVGNKYTRVQILDNLNEQLKAATQVSSTESYMKLLEVDPSNNFSSWYFQLKLKPDRYTTNNNVNSKMAVIFPVETDLLYNIWTGDTTSCFGFTERYYEVNNIIGELPSVPENSIFNITTRPYILLTCSADGFVTYGETKYGSTYNYMNDISMSLSNATYTSPAAYINAINSGIYNSTKKITNTNSTPASVILSAQNPDTYKYSNTDANPPVGTLAYIDINNKFNFYVDVANTFTESMYKMDITGFLTSSLYINAIPILTDLTDKYVSTEPVASASYIISNNETIAIVTPRYGIEDISRNGNEGDNGYIIKNNTGADIISNSFQDIATNINILFTNYVDAHTTKNIFQGTSISYVQDPLTGKATFTLSIKIIKTLTAADYKIQFLDEIINTNYSINSWNTNFKVDPSMCRTAFDLNREVVISATTSSIISFKNVFNEVNITGNEQLVSSNLLRVTTNNNTITFTGYESGVYDSAGANDVTITIPPNSYSIDTLLSAINLQIASSATLTSIKGTYFSQKNVNNVTYIKIRTNLNRVYSAKDYNLVFYDLFSFAYCPPGVKSYQNTTWDTTLGWLLGFHEYTVYYLSLRASSGTTSISLTGETFVDTTLYKNVLICLDDFNQNHLNDGLVTLSPKDSNIPLPSYANLYNFQCNPATGELYYDSAAIAEYSKLTQKQTYSIAQIVNSKSANKLTANSLPTAKNPGKSYGFGPYVTDVFANVPLKLSGLTPGQSFVEFGGTLQDQNRYYFGPVNIHRMGIKLVTDRGNVLDLNGSNWSVGIICEQLNNLSTGTSGTNKK